MKHKIIFIILLLCLLASCTGVGKKRSEKSDEFLIEKKNPLVMPPDIDDLPKPKESISVEEKDNDFKKSLQSTNSEIQQTNKDPSDTLQESIIRKLEN
tara:strand:- start:9 stop:302 length:294 start_codon:yes stop_codon:yes gene_type:complete